MKAIARNSELEVSLKTKEDELELSRDVMVENADLQAKVAGLTTELGMKLAKIDELRGELTMSADRLTTTISEAMILEDALRTCKSERDKEEDTFVLKVAGLEGHVKELEAKLSVLTRQVASLRIENASQRPHPSAFRASADTVVHRRLYEL